MVTSDRPVKPSTNNILLTGGTGYIGSHTAVVLVEAGYQVHLYDNLFNSNAAVLDQLAVITGKEIPFIEGDVRDTEQLQQSLKANCINSVIHFAGLKAVGESIEKPIQYYDNNIAGTISLLKAMESAGTENLVFSSSATVYGDPQYLPLDEAHPTSAENPYGRSKLHIEEILADLIRAVIQPESRIPEWKIANLRYFTPVGAHDSGLIGEDPNGIPNNLMPYIAQVASGKLPFLNVFGDDYDTPDGTGVRDYIHIMDLAEGHLAALRKLEKLTAKPAQMHTYNLGTETGYSVLEMVHAFEKASGQPVTYKITERRPGDIATCYAKAEKAQNELGWHAKRTLEQMCRSIWKFQQKR